MSQQALKARLHTMHTWAAKLELYPGQQVVMSGQLTVWTVVSFTLFSKL
jgi:hypothetical protein